MTLPADVGGTPTAVIDMADEVSTVTTLGGRYELGPVVGRGGMSTVYEALDRHTGQKVAVKVFRPGVELADSPDRRRREVDLASALTNPGVVAVLDSQVDDADRVDGCAYIVAEFVDGPTLGQRIALAPLTEHEVIGLGAALSETLAYVHSAGIIHRDIKPANVLLASSDDGLLNPKLTDFGIAVMVDSTRMTATGFMAGTANYLSPEQVLGQPVTAASDVYSLGLVLLEALTGATIYAGHGIEAALARLNVDPQPPSWISPELARLLATMTARNPARRPTTEAARGAFRRLTGQGLISDVFALDADTQTSPTAGALLLGTKFQRRRAVLGACIAAGALTTSLVLVLSTGSYAGLGSVANTAPTRSSTTGSGAPTASTPVTSGAPTQNASTTVAPVAPANPPAAGPSITVSIDASPSAKTVPVPPGQHADNNNDKTDDKTATKAKKKQHD
jgi:serine/threonine protein kinase